MGVELSRRGAVFALSAVLLLVAIVLSLMVGSQPLSPARVMRALLQGGAADPLGIVRGLRLQRTAVAVVVGLALGGAGASMQALTRNPLADPGLFGINAGAAAAVVTGFSFLGISTAIGQMWCALAGASVAAVAVFVIGARGGAAATPARLALAGAALSAVLLSYIDAVSLSSQENFEALRVWIVGSVVNRGWDVLAVAFPFIVAGMLIGLAATPGLNALALGEEAGRGLGLRIGRARVLTALAVVLLAGGATAVAGPIGFVGLTVPHVAKAVVGPDQRLVVPLSMLVAAVFLVLADVIGRVVAPPGEVQAGIVTAVVGGPVFIALVRRRRLVAS